MPIIASDADVAAGLAVLVAADGRLAPVLAEAGAVPLRRFAPGYAGLARVIVGQQISVHAAAAIWGRFVAVVGEAVAPEAVLAADEPALRGAGLSAGKFRTLRAAATACVADGLDLVALAEAESRDAVARLVHLPGVGPWTAELYLMFCAGHADIFPGGDLALRVALADALALAARPSDAEARAIAAPWAPWRSVAARLLWAYYGRRRLGVALDPV